MELAPLPVRVPDPLPASLPSPRAKTPWLVFALSTALVIAVAVSIAMAIRLQRETPAPTPTDPRMGQLEDRLEALEAKRSDVPLPPVTVQCPAATPTFVIEGCGNE